MKQASNTNPPISELVLGVGQARGGSPPAAAGEESARPGLGSSCQAITEAAAPLHPPSGT